MARTGRSYPAAAHYAYRGRYADVVVSKTDSDLGTGADTTGQLEINAAESGTWVESSSSTATTTSNDLGTGTDTSYVLGVVDLESGAGTDTSSLTATLTSTDAGTGSPRFDGYLRSRSSLWGYWRLGESSGTAAVGYTAAGNGTYVNSPTLGVAGLLDADSDTAITLTGSSSQRVDLPIRTGKGVWSSQARVWNLIVSYVFLIKTTSTTGTIFTESSASDGHGTVVGLDSGKPYLVGGGDSTATTDLEGLQSFAAVNDGLRHLVVIVTGTGGFYHDGVKQLAGGLTFGGGWYFGGIDQSVLGAQYSNNGAGTISAAYRSFLTATVDEFAVVNRGITSDEVATLWRLVQNQGLQEALVGVQGSDVGTGAQSESSTATQTRSESGTGADTSYLLNVGSFDLGAGTEAFSSTSALTSTDQGQGLQDAVVGLLGSEVGTGSESGSSTAALISSEPGTGADTSYVLNLTELDVGTGTDTEFLGEFLNFTSSDVGSGTDTSYALEVVVVDLDQGIGGDLETAAAALVDVDTASGLEAYLLSLTTVDQGVSAEAELVGLTAGDAGGGTDAYALILGSTDTGSSIENAFIDLIGEDFGAGVETSLLGIFLELFDSDSAQGVDSEELEALVASSDEATAIDLALLVLSSTDTATFVDQAFSVASMASTDMGTGLDLSSTTALVFSSDSFQEIEPGVFTDVASTEKGFGHEFERVLALTGWGELLAVTAKEPAMSSVLDSIAGPDKTKTMDPLLGRMMDSR